MKIIDRKLQQLISAPLIVGFTLLAFGCDTFEEDNIIEAIPAEENVEVTALAQNTTVIDLKSAFTINGPISVNIDREPTLGELQNVGNELLKYTPDRSVVFGKDLIGFSVYGSNQNLLFADSINIDIVTDVSDSCQFMAVSDTYYVPVDSTLLLDILMNDLVCDSTILLSIASSPLTGVAAVDGRKIRYTANGSTSRDEFVYTISKSDSTLSSSALVTVHVGVDSCVVRLNDDFTTYDLGIQGLKVAVLDNDELCNNQVTATVSQQALYGTASFDQNNFLSYVSSRDSSYIDSLRYQVCITGDCFDAKVRLDIFSSQCNTLIARDDFYQLADTTSGAGYFLAVTSNDTFCDETFLEVLNQPQQATITVDNNGLFYSPDSSAVTNGTFDYKICYTDSTRCDIAAVTIERQ